jgi:hypothetical protein
MGRVPRTVRHAKDHHSETAAPALDIVDQVVAIVVPVAILHLEHVLPQTTSQPMEPVGRTARLVKAQPSETAAVAPGIAAKAAISAALTASHHLGLVPLQVTSRPTVPAERMGGLAKGQSSETAAADQAIVAKQMLSVIRNVSQALERVEQQTVYRSTVRAEKTEKHVKALPSEIAAAARAIAVAEIPSVVKDVSLRSVLATAARGPFQRMEPVGKMGRLASAPRLATAVRGVGIADQ